MKLFNRQNAELKTMNRVLTDAARKRSERIEELEFQLAQLRQVVAGREQEASNSAAISDQQAVEINLLNQELSAVRQAAAERAFRLNEMNQELADVREAATKRAILLNEMNQELGAVREAATKYAAWAQELDRILSEIGSRELERERAWGTFAEPLGLGYRRQRRC